MDAVTPLLHWRQRRDSHTRELVKESLPEEVRELLVDMAAKLLAHETRIQALEQIIAALAKEAAAA